MAQDDGALEVSGSQTGRDDVPASGRVRWVQSAVRSAPRLEVLLDLDLTDPDGSGALDSLAELAASIAKSSYAALSVAMPQRLVFAGAYGVADRIMTLPVEETMCGHVVAGGRPLNVQAAAGGVLPDILAGNALQTYVGHPVVVDGEVLASLCVFDAAPLELDAAQHRQLAAVARHASDLLAMRRELYRLRAEVDRHGAEGEVLAHLSAGRPLARLLSVLTAELVRSGDGDAVPGLVGVVLVRDGEALRLAAASGVDDALAERLAHVPISSRAGLVGSAAAMKVVLDGTGRGPDLLVEPWAAGFDDLGELRDGEGGSDDGEPAYSEPAYTGSRFGGSAYGESPSGTSGSAWGRAVPLLEDDEVVGMLAVVVPAGGGVPDGLEARLSATAGLCSLAMRRSRIAAQTDELAIRDGLTGLLNRLGFVSAARESLDGVEGPHALLSLDVDRLKVLNDSLGHQRGDDVLRAVATRLRDTVRRTDVVARLGGDEFAVLCPGLDAAAATERASVLAEQLARPVHLGDATVSAVVSIGVATADAADDVQALVLAAERALAQAKRSGRGRVAVIDSAASTQAQESSELELDLRRLLASGGDPASQLHLEFQPQIALADGAVCGVEALLRWGHPRLGSIPPIRFIPLAEDAGLMPALGAFVLEEALQQHRRWVEEGSPFAAATMWVNISATQLNDPAFPVHVHAALARDPAAPHRLGLEITESVVTTQSTTTRNALQQLRSLGVRLAVDDFGTGFSNLALLRSTPVDVLKIDRSLVAGIGTGDEDTRLVDAVLGLAQALDLDVVAEGVETTSQLEALAGRDCTSVQGYLLGRPSRPELLTIPDRISVRHRRIATVVPVQQAPSTPAASTLPDFDAAARAVLRHLRSLTGMSLWTVTRAAGPDQVVLVSDSASAEYRLEEGAVLPWQSSLCAQMVRGAPTVAPDVDAVPAYATAPNRAHLKIGAYVGVPLHDHNGDLFGSLCAYDASPQPEELHRVEPTVRLLAQLLSTVLSAELRSDELASRAEKAEVDAAIDPLTGVANRRGWADALAREDARCRRYGHEAAVIVVDLDALKATNDSLGHAAGDDLLRAAAQTLRGHARTGDLVARLGGDEFGVLAVHTGASGARAELSRLRRALTAVGVSASAGLAARLPGGTLTQAWQRADEAMYEDKQARRVEDARPVTGAT